MGNLTNSAKLIEKIGGLNVTKVGASAPSNPVEGNLWYDTTNDVLKSYDGTNWKDVGSDAADINTKTFYLSSISDLTTAQAIYDWYNDGKNPIIIFQKGVYLNSYVYKTKGSGTLYFKSLSLSSQSNANTTSYITHLGLEIAYSDDTVTTITQSNSDVSGNYLKTDTNYSTPYTPTYDGSPATKKYVDDSISTAVASAYKYKGSVSTYSALPASGNTTGDVWNVTDTDMNYAWTGTAWDQLGSTVDLSNYLAKNNSTAFTPTGDYNPSTKKYVDDKSATVMTEAQYGQVASPTAGKIYFIKEN